MFENVNLTGIAQWVINGVQRTGKRPPSPIHTRTVAQACYRRPNALLGSFVRIRGEGATGWIGRVVEVRGEGSTASLTIGLAYWGYSSQQGRWTWLPTGKVISRRRHDVTRRSVQRLVIRWPGLMDSLWVEPELGDVLAVTL